MLDGERYRPQLHFSAKRNWINDPNGLIYWDGEYHLFFQYNPFGDQWGHMSWGHAVSTDLVHWTELPVAIPEDERASIFSGSVVVDFHNSSGFGDGKTPPLVAIYTGCLRVPTGGQAQELAFSHDRGRTWVKYEGNPVLDLGMRDFRDPKVFWHVPTSRWVMLVSMAHEYRLAFYVSSDLRDWTFLSDFKSEDTQQGIWECPDIFEMPLDEEGSVWVVKVDVLEGHPSKGSGARLFFGNFDGTHFTACDEPASPWADYGADFYAAVAWGNTQDVRKQPVWIGWMNCHRYAKHLPTAPWRGAMSVPREISLRRTSDGLQFLQRPVPELESLRKNLLFDGSVSLADQCLVLVRNMGDRAMEIELACVQSSASVWGGRLQTGPQEEIRWGYDCKTAEVFVDRSVSGFLPDDPHFAQRRSAKRVAPAAGDVLRMRVYIDRCSMEVFVNDGDIVLTEQFFPQGHDCTLGLFADAGSASFSRVQVWQLESAL